MSERVLPKAPDEMTDEDRWALVALSREVCDERREYFVHHAVQRGCPVMREHMLAPTPATVWEHRDAIKTEAVAEMIEALALDVRRGIRRDMVDAFFSTPPPAPKRPRRQRKSAPTAEGAPHA
jgi:hypothetical protein